jgi:hypothetical protein
MDIDLTTIEIEGVDLNDYPDFADAFISRCQFKDGTELNEGQLNALTDNQGQLINQLIHDKQLYF